MKEKKIKVFGRYYKYTEHKGIILFNTIMYIKIFDKEKKGNPNLEIIYKFNQKGYDLISISFLDMIFKKRKQ